MFTIIPSSEAVKRQKYLKEKEKATRNGDINLYAAAFGWFVKSYGKSNVFRHEKTPAKRGEITPKGSLLLPHIQT